MRPVILIALMVLCTCLTANAQSSVKITTVVDFGRDRGQNFGTLFEARNAAGNLVAGAGFVGVYNTRHRYDRHTLQFFVRPKTLSFDVEPLPRANADSGCYIFNHNGRLYAANHFYDAVIRWWDETTGKWMDDPEFEAEKNDRGDVVMHVAGKPLRCIDSQIRYDGKLILDRPDVGNYHHFYYAAGHLVFFHNNRRGDPAFSRLYACQWDPDANQPLNLDRTAVLDVTHPGETPFAIGQLHGKIVNSSNRGGVYLFDGKAWQVLRSPQKTGSYQLYSMLNWHDKLLMAHYPSGHLYEYDGDTIRELSGWPPVMPGVSGAAREAQTTCIIGGDIYVGVWPWAELWRRDANTGKWSFIQRMFTQPPLTDAVDHPWDQQVIDYNKTHGTKILFNNWGHRVTGLVPMGRSFYVSTSSKGGWPAKNRLDFLTDEIWDEYGRVYRITIPGVVSVPIEWKASPTTLEFTVSGDRMIITQDGKTLAEAPAPKVDLDDWRMTWAEGVFGDLGGRMTDHRVHVTP